MSKTLKTIIFSIIGIVVCYLVYFIYITKRYSHSPNWYTYKNYLSFFKDSVKNDLDTNFCYSYVQKHDIYNSFNYKHEYYISIWEFKDLNRAELKKVSINQNINLDDVKFSSGEVLNKKTDLEITIKFGFDFNHTMNINLDNHSKIERAFETASYKGFYGTINKMSLSDGKGEHQVLLNYTEGKTPTVFLLYKSHQSFYVIMINSEQPFDEKIINILNLP